MLISQCLNSGASVSWSVHSRPYYNVCHLIKLLYTRMTGLIEILERAQVIVPTGPKRKANKEEALKRSKQEDISKSEDDVKEKAKG